MSDINKIIKDKLKDYPPDIQKFALEAMQRAEEGLTEISVSEHLASVVRQLIKARGFDE